MSTATVLEAPLVHIDAAIIATQRITKKFIENKVMFLVRYQPELKRITITSNNPNMAKFYFEAFEIQLTDRRDKYAELVIVYAYD